MTAPMLLDGPMHGVAFPAYVEQVLVPTLAPGDVVVMHHPPGTVAVPKAGGEAVYQADGPVGRAQQQHSSVRRNRPAAKIGRHTAAFKACKDRRTHITVCSHRGKCGLRPGVEGPAIVRRRRPLVAAALPILLPGVRQYADGA